MFGRRILQSLKALKRAPQGTLAFRSYLLIIYRTVSSYKDFGSALTTKWKLERIKKGLMNEVLTGKKRVKA